MTERMNMMRIGVPESPPAAPLKFEPMRDIKPEEWSAIESVRSTFASEDIGQLELLKSLVMMKKDFTYDATIVEWAGMHRELDKYRLPKMVAGATEDQRPDFTIYASYMHLLHPGRKIDITSSDWEDIDGTLMTLFSQKRDFLEMAAAVHILDPKRKLPILKTGWKQLEHYIKGVRDSGQWGLFAEAAADIRIITDGKGIDVHERDWQGMFAWLEDLRGRNGLYQMVRQAFNMHVLAAPQLAVTKNGIELPKVKTHSDFKERPQQQPPALNLPHV